MWSDLVQEETQQNTKDGSSSKHDDEENHAFAGKVEKWKGKSFHSKSYSSQGFKKDMSKIKCFHCHELGHYATKCLHKKASKKPSGGAASEALASQFELDFTLVSCMVTLMMGTVWYLNSGTFFHMTKNKYLFIDLEEKDLQVHFELGDNGRYNTADIVLLPFKGSLVLLSH